MIDNVMLGILKKRVARGELSATVLEQTPATEVQDHKRTLDDITISETVSPLLIDGEYRTGSCIEPDKESNWKEVKK